MKKLTLLFACLSAFAFFPLHAQTKTSVDLVKAVQELSNLLINPDEAKLKKLTDKRLTYGHSSGREEDQQTFIASLMSGKSDFVSIDLQNQSYKVVDDIGIARHILDAETNDGGNPGHVRIGVMLVWRDTGDAWKLVARQAYKLP